MLDGVKSLVPRAADAELFVVAADLEGGRGPALFIVESGTEGVFTEPEPGDGPARGRHAPADPRRRRAARRARCSPRARPRSTASASSARAWPGARSPSAPRQAVLDYVIPYVNERVAFGEPIANRQAVAFTVADIGIELEGMRLADLPRRQPRRPGQGLRPATTALARQLCSEKGMEIGSDGVQLLGGHGFVKEHPVERWYRDLRAAGLMEGALLV